MAYILVMGGLALSVSFTLGWILVRSGRWAWQRVTGGGGSRKPRPRARKAPARQASPRSRPTPAARKSKAATPPREPWRLTRGLAALRGTRPLTLLVLLLYGLTRLAEFGMTQRPQAAPAAYHTLVTGLGWACAAMLALAVLHLLAVWRCRRST